MNTVWFPSYKECRSSPVEYDIANVQGAMCAEEALLREYRIVEDSGQVVKARAWIYDWVEVISKLYNSGSERYVKRVVVLPHAENFGLNGILEKLKNVSAFI